MKSYIYFFLFVLLVACTKDKALYEENIIVKSGNVYYNLQSLESSFKVMFLSDTHFTVEDSLGYEYYDYSKRMGGFAVEPENYGISNGREKALLVSLERAKKDSVDLVILGGDIINFPSVASVDSVQNIMEQSGLKWEYISGNHDWHYEGEPGIANEQRARWINSNLNPLYQGQNPFFRSVILHGINFVLIDNSTNEIMEEQLAFLKGEIKKGLPIILSVHVPIYFPGQNIDYSCGNPNWNEEHDIYYKIERREPWPANGHTKVTYEFCDIVTSEPLIIGIFAGHTHEVAVDYYNDKIQYVSGANYAGSDVMIHFNKINSRK